MEVRPSCHFNRWERMCEFPNRKTAEDFAKRIGAYGKSLGKAYRATFVPAAELTRKPKRKGKRK